MSYDFYMHCECCGHTLYENNYTSNVAPMFSYCMKDPRHIKSISGITGKRALPVLQQLRECMVMSETYLLTMNPSNGWGNYEGALELVESMIKACEDNPRNEWTVSY